MLERLYGLQEAGVAALKDLVAQRALRPGAEELFGSLTSCILKALPAKVEIHLSILEQLSLAWPKAFHQHLESFFKWLKPQEDLVFSVAACKILSQVLPSCAKGEQSEKLVDDLSLLLDESTAPSNDLGQLARAVVQCLAVVIERLLPSKRDLLLGHFGRTLRCLSEGLQGGVSDAKLCRYTWILGSLLEFLDQSSMEQLGETVCRQQGVQVVCQAAVRLLAECGLNGPPTAKPAMITALGFALRRHPLLLEMDPLSPLEVLQQGLEAGGSLRQQAADTVANLAAEAEASGAQKLASLQEQLLACLEDPKAAPAALRAFRSLCDQGVVHPHSALPHIIAVSLCDQQLTGHARPLLLRLVESGPPLLAQRCGSALNTAARRLESQEVYGDAWRYAPLLEAYALLDSKQLRDQFVSSLVSEGLQEASLTRLELLTGLLARLITREAELMRLFHSLVQFLTLKLPHGELRSAAVLHQLCLSWWQQLPPELAKLMRSTWSKPFMLPTEDQPLPASLSRQLPELKSLFAP